jgi:hypothetical protein
MEEFEESVRDYWRVRAGQRRRQEERGVVDVGAVQRPLAVSR